MNKDIPLHLISSSDSDDEGSPLDLASRLQKKRNVPRFSPKFDSYKSDSLSSQPNSQTLCSQYDERSKQHLSNENLKDSLPDCDLDLPILEEIQTVKVHRNVRSEITSKKSNSREQKKAEKERLVQKKKEEKLSKQATQPGQCNKHILVNVDSSLASCAEGAKIVDQVIAAEFQCQVKNHAIAGTVTFSRIDSISKKEERESEVVWVLSAGDFVSKVTSDDGGALAECCARCKRDMRSETLTLLICGLDDVYKKNKKETNRKMRDAIIGPGKENKRKKLKKDSSLSDVSRLDVETSLVCAQLDERVDSRLCADANAVAEAVVHIAKAVASRPYKLHRSCDTFSWFAEGSSKQCVKVDSGGVGLARLWRQQLRQLPAVGTEAADAIANKFPSPQSLIQSYRRLSAREGLALLADVPVRRGVGVLATTRRVGPELSSKIYNFFNGQDSEALI